LEAVEKPKKKLAGERGVKEWGEGERKKEMSAFISSIVWVGMTWVNVP